MTIKAVNKRRHKITSTNNGKTDKRQEKMEVFCEQMYVRNLCGFMQVIL